MKVKQKSNKPFWSIDVVCSGDGNASINGKKGAVPCGSTLEVNLNDIFITNTYSYGEVDDVCFTIKCSECGSYTDIPKKDIPSDIKSYLYARKNSGKNGQERDM